MADRKLTADIIARMALPILDNELGVLTTVHRGLESEYSKRINGYKIGETISIRRPVDYTVVTGKTRVDQDSVEGKVALTVDTQKHVSFSFDSADMTLDVTDIAERDIRPAMVNLANEVARDVFDSMYWNAYNWAGTPGETLDSYTDFIKGPERLDEMAVPQDSRNAILSPADYWSLVGSNTALFTTDAVTGSLRRGQLGMLGNISTWMSQVTPTHTVGVATGTPLIDGANQNVLYDAVKDTWSQSLVTKGWTNDTAGILKQGDVFTIAGVNMVNPKTRADTGIPQQFTVLADANSGATTGPATLTIAPPIIAPSASGDPTTKANEEQYQTVTAAPADNAAITVLGSGGTAYKQNMVYHKNAMACAVVPMELPSGNVDAGRASRNGLSVRVVQDYDIDADNNIWRLDILYGKRLIDPRLISRLSGTA